MMSLRRVIFLIIGIAALMPRGAWARTELFFDAPARLHPGTPTVITLRARITDAINALQGTLRFNPAQVDIIAVDTGNSAIRLWVVPPTVNTTGRIEFSGVVLGGISPALTNTVPLFQFTVRSRMGAETVLTVDDPLVYLNQPHPTADQVVVHPTLLFFSRAAPSATAVTSAPAAPDLYLKVVREPLLYENAWTLVFDVQDRTGQPASVRVRERFLGLFGPWHDAINPYRLNDQHRLSIVDFEVVSHAGQRYVRHIIPIPLLVAWGVIGVLILSILYRAARRKPMA